MLPKVTIRRVPHETMKHLDCSVFGGPTLGIVSRVFDNREGFLSGYFSGKSMFDVRVDHLENGFSGIPRST